MLIRKTVASTKAVWKTVLFVTPYIREKRGCAGDIAPIPNFCLEGSTTPIRYSLPGWLVDGGSISEGILSFVEYAPRLRMVLPSRQLLITRLAKILKSILKILAENKDQNPFLVSPSYGLCLLQIPCWCEFSFSLVSLGGFPRKWASPSGSHYGKTKYGDKIAPCGRKKWLARYPSRMYLSV